MLSTDPEYPIGTPVKIGDTLMLDARTVIVFRES